MGNEGPPPHPSALFLSLSHRNLEAGPLKLADLLGVNQPESDPPITFSLPPTSILNSVSVCFV